MTTNTVSTFGQLAEQARHITMQRVGDTLVAREYYEKQNEHDGRWQRFRMPGTHVSVHTCEKEHKE